MSYLRCITPLLCVLQITGLVSLQRAWDPYCPWEQPGINKPLYSCYNKNLTQKSVNSSLKRIVKVGLLFPKSPALCTRINLFTQGKAAEIAVEDVNEDADLIPGYKLELVVASNYESCGRTFDTLGYAYTLRVEEGADVLVGPACGDRSSGESVASFAAAENIPVISVASFQDELNNVTRYPTFTRVLESTEIQAFYHAAICQYLGWRQIVTIVQGERNPQCTVKFRDLTRTLKSIVENDSIKSFSLDSENNLEEAEMRNILKNNRIISLFVGPPVAKQLVLSFYRLCVRMISCSWFNYRFLAVNFRIGLSFSNEKVLPWRCDQSDRDALTCRCCDERGRKDDEEAKLAFKSVIYVVPDLPKFSEQDEFFCKLMRKIEEKPTCVEDVYLAQHVYDTILVYANALHATRDPADGRRISDEIKRSNNITGKSGKIITNQKGSRYTEMLAYFLLDEADDAMTAVLKLTPERNTGEYSAALIPGQKSPSNVSDQPPCRWDDLKCVITRNNLIIIVCALIASVLSITVLRIWVTKTRAAGQSLFLTTDQLNRLVESNNESRPTDKRVKPMVVRRTGVVVSPSDKKTIALLRDLNRIHHSNIVQLLHCSLDISGMTIVLENCQKGPLQYLIRTEQRLQTASFIRSFATDILRGLDFLNGSMFSYHGCLTSLNCVVDGNWNVKLKGFYLRQIEESEVYTNQGAKMRPLDDPLQVYNKLWMSPQYLNKEITNTLGFQKNDIYSFGVILAELINREPPFGIFFEKNIDHHILYDQISLIKEGEKPLKDEILRTMCFSSRTSSLSSLSTSGISKESIMINKNSTGDTGGFESNTAIDHSEDDGSGLNLIMQLSFLCTLYRPEDRPTVPEILDRLQRGSQRYLGSIVDQWLLELEKKSRELKELFDIKNKDLLREKEKTKELVYSLLPREIAEQKIGSNAPVVPKVYSNCSFFYSDIKGFTSIVADLTNLSDGGPMDVVEMLDNLYTIMDKAIGQNDVVKIETIGDAYVVVSGLPVPDINDAVHAKHIASFALDVLSTTKDITVRRLNNRPVYMRIGIHSGCCVAGLAGNYMYHYCIYGKEPRYANCLESSGEANRIHMSNDMRLILDSNFQYQFSIVERKPPVKIPGFKTKRTWWLTGQAGFPRDMPCDQIYQQLEFKRRSSNSSIPNAKLIKGLSRMKSDVSIFHQRERSVSSENSGKKRIRYPSLSGLQKLTTECRGNSLKKSSTAR